MSYPDYSFAVQNQNYAFPEYMSPTLSHEEYFPSDQPRSQHGRHGSYSQYDVRDFNQYSQPQYVQVNTKHRMSHLPANMSAEALEEQRASYSPVSSPASRHSSNAATSPTSRPMKEADDRAYCDHPDCRDEFGRSRRSFSRKADVARHYRSAHEPRFIDCPRKNCIRKGDQGFTRPDHLVEHRRQFHMEAIPKKNRSSEQRRDGKGRHSA